MALSEKQKLFVKEYLTDRNATQAAIRAGYSAHSATEQGSRLLTYAKVKAAVEKATAGRIRRLDITADKIIEEIGSIAFTDVTKKKAFQPIKAGDKLKALELLAKNQKLLTDVQETTGANGGPMVILTMPSNSSESTPESNDDGNSSKD